MTKGKEGRKAKRIYKILAGILIFLLVLLVIIVLVGLYFYKSGEKALRDAAVTSAPTIAATQQQQRSDYEQKQQQAIPWQDDWVVFDDTIYEYKEDCLNFLLMGIDRGGKLSSDTNLSNWSAGQADAVFLVSLDPQDKQVSIIGIPRNAMVNLEIYNSQGECTETMYNQVCLQYGYAGGGELGLTKMKERVSEIFYGLPIHGACAISFDAMGVIADRLGGITVTVPDDLTAVNRNYTVGSTVTLTGKNIIPYLRWRDNSELGSPTTRLTRQKEFLKTAVSTIVQAAKKNPAVISDIYQAVMPYMNTDITLDKAVYLAAESLDYSITDSSFRQLTGTDRRVDFDHPVQSYDFYDDFYLDEAYLTQTVRDVFYRKVRVD